MNILSTLLNGSEQKQLQARRMKAMQDIIAVTGTSPSDKYPDEFCDFKNEEWLVEQLEHVPTIIGDLTTDWKIKLQAANDSIIDKRITRIYQAEKENRELKSENQRLKEENELLRSDKVKVVILR